MTVTELPHNATCRIVRAGVKPNQRYTVFVKTTARHGLDVPPFYHLLDIQISKMLQELSKLGGIHLFIFELAIMVVLWLILTRRNNGRIKQFKLLV